MDILKNLEKILGSDVQNYLESSERLFLMNILVKLKNKTDELSDNDQILLNKIIKKYNLKHPPDWGPGAMALGPWGVQNHFLCIFSIFPLIWPLHLPHIQL